MQIFLFVFLILAACGNPEPKQTPAPTGIEGVWRAEFPHATGQFDLHVEDVTIRGVLGIDDYVWAITGETLTEREFYLVLLPSREEDALFAALGFTLATAPALAPTHAADRIEFRVESTADFGRASGTARSRFGAETLFSLRR